MISLLAGRPHEVIQTARHPLLSLQIRVLVDQRRLLRRLADDSRRTRPATVSWDRLNTRVSHAMRELIAERAWLTVFLLPAYSPDLNPVEWVWAHVKRSLANLAVMALDRLEALVRNRLKRLQCRPDTLDGFIAGTGLTLDTPTSP
ncbi:transposase [Streptomyces sp. NPDC056323]|uniref:transposase n=1 Tax=Streptomyces sp. NPDC056323 TaxID=3345784 RepID=UPI0035DCCDB9